MIVLIREPLTIMLTEQRRRAGGTSDVSSGELRDYGVGAQILIDLGVKEMVLLSNSKKERRRPRGFGLKIINDRSQPTRQVVMSTRSENPTVRPAVAGVKGAHS